MNLHNSPTGRKQFLRDFLPAAALTLAIAFLLTLYGPLELFFTNLSEFRFSFSILFPELLKLFLLLFAVGLLAFALCYALHIRLYRVVLLLGAVGFVCTYIQGMFLSGSLPPLDGRAIRWSDYLLQDVVSVILWLAVGTAAVLLFRRLSPEMFSRLVTGISLFLTSILLVTLVTVGIMNHGFSTKYEAVLTKDSAFTMSSDQNFVIFILDAVDSAAFQELLEGVDPQFADTLSDFTYYPNTVGAYPFTRESIPFILTGKWFENQEDFPTFTARAMDESPLLSTLKSEDYRMGVYEEDLTYPSDNVYAFENAKKISPRIKSFNMLARKELSLVWFKYAPFPLKRLSHIQMDVFNQLLALPDGEEVFRAHNAEFYNDLRRAEITTVPEKCFRFIHIEGAHVPFRYDKNVRLISESQGSYLQNIEAGMTIVKTYLQKLKDAGVYDNTVIFLMADHGYGYNRNVAIVGRGNPLLAVKGLHESHPLAVSDAPISYEDLQTAYARTLSGMSAAEAFDAREGDDRPRRFLYYEYQNEHHMQEYTQQGHASDIKTMIPTGQRYDRPRGGPGKDAKSGGTP